jgi:epoxyqueuosine reductase
MFFTVPSASGTGYDDGVRSAVVKRLARECGFELAGVTPARPLEDSAVFLDWVAGGMAGAMSYLTDHRATIRTDPRHLLPSARSVICVARSYNRGPNEPETPISCYAQGEDYHDVLKRELLELAARLRAEFGPFESRVCVDTAPLLERSYARMAGLGWIGKNTCLIDQRHGSYVFLGELLVSLDLEPDTPAPYRCGTCTRCIDACPTLAIQPGGHATLIDSRRCISYLTIELRGNIPSDMRADVGEHVFGCDICQEVCPWNRKAQLGTDLTLLGNGDIPVDLEALARLTPDEFRAAFRNTAVWRTRYSGFLRNVVVAMGNAGDRRYQPMLEALADSQDEVIAEHARWALDRIQGPGEGNAQTEGGIQ